MPQCAGPTDLGGWGATEVGGSPNGTAARFAHGNSIVHAMPPDARPLSARSTDGGAPDMGHGLRRNANLGQITDAP